jgi:hypothetical protein
MKLIASIAVGLLAVSPALADNFWASCVKETVKVKDNILTAHCRNAGGGDTCSVLDLSTCITNDYGKLKEDRDGTG